MKAHRHAIRNIFSHQTLREIAKRAISFPKTIFGDQDFALFHKELIEGAFPSFNINFTTTNIIRFAEDESTLGSVSICLGISPKLIDQYLDVADFDTLAPISYANCGRAVIFDPDTNPQKWRLRNEFENHCSDFAIARAIQIAFQHPTKQNIFLSIEYLGEAANKSWRKLQYNRLELATFPIALAWFYRKEVLDDAELLRRFRSLEDFTETQLLNLRKLVNSPFEGYRRQASALGIKTGSYKEGLYLIRDKVSSRLGWDLDQIDNTHMKMRPVEVEYNFMRMLGDHTYDISAEK